jgi:D-lactate dehydrogenase, membrane binding
MLSDKIMHGISRLFPNHLPKRMREYRNKYEHHLLLKMPAGSINDARLFLESRFPSSQGDFFEWSSDQDRSAKAINRTADVNVQEKSDCAVVPMNQPNKEGQPSAEAGEGRAQTEENIVQSHMHPTQSGKCMSQGMHGARQAALPPTSLVRAVCVNALVRICAGGDQRWSSLPRQLQYLHHDWRETHLSLGTPPRKPLGPRPRERGEQCA